jgi:hypothetical protein
VKSYFHLRCKNAFHIPDTIVLTLLYLLEDLSVFNHTMKRYFFSRADFYKIAHCVGKHSVVILRDILIFNNIHKRLGVLAQTG